MCVLRLRCVALLVLLSSPAHAAPPGRGFVERVYEDEAGAHRYAVFVPHDYTPRKKWPIVLFLHGAAERGTDGKKPTQVGLGPAIRARASSFPYIAVFPQVEARRTRYTTGWAPDSPAGRRAMAILEQVERDYSVDTGHRILTGWSMGGYGSWLLGAANPDKWAAVVPISGGGDVPNVARLKGVPVWAFHGANDNVVDPDESRQAVQALRDAGGQPRLSIVPGVGHDVWKVAYTTDALYEWIENPIPGDPEGVADDVRVTQKANELPETEGPFVPAVEIPGALYVHIGNDVMDAVSYALPDLAPRGFLRGRIPDFHDTARSGGHSFRVRMSRIRYSGRLERTRVQSGEDGRLLIQMGLSRVRISIGRTNVDGFLSHAVAGRTDVVIGHRKPVWLSVKVTPYVQDRELRLRTHRAWFEIPRDNWYVTYPRGVRTSLFLPRSLVRENLVRGLYGSKRDIERQVRSVVPRLVDELEERLDVAVAADLMDQIWPLPVYRPRVRTWPEAVLVDEHGATLRLGMTAAAVDYDNAPETPKRLAPLGPELSELPRDGGVRTSVAPGFLHALTELLAETNLPRIHVLDVPEPTFADFIDRDFLEQAIPEAKRFGPKAEFWSEVVLAGPMNVVDAGKRPDGEDEPRPFAFDVPQLKIEVLVKPTPDEEEYQPFAEFDFALRQRARINALAPGWVTRGVEMDWVGDPEITAKARFSKGYEPEKTEFDVDTIRSKFREGWIAFTGQRPVLRQTVPDLEVGTARLRLERAAWQPPLFQLRFEVPGVRLTNDSGRPLEYEVKGPHSGWGGPYTLQPGDHDLFDVRYPLVYRHRVDGRYREYTLPSGSDSSYVVPEDQPGGVLYKARQPTLQ